MTATCIELSNNSKKIFIYYYVTVAKCHLYQQKLKLVDTEQEEKLPSLTLPLHTSGPMAWLF